MVMIVSQPSTFSSSWKFSSRLYSQPPWFINLSKTFRRGGGFECHCRSTWPTYHGVRQASTVRGPLDPSAENIFEKMGVRGGGRPPRNCWEDTRTLFQPRGDTRTQQAGRKKAKKSGGSGAQPPEDFCDFAHEKHDFSSIPTMLNPQKTYFQLIFLIKNQKKKSTLTIIWP
jgi:hypothetical protein